MRDKGKVSEKKKILYVQTSGLDTPERLYAPFILAMTAQAMDLDASIYFLIKGITVLQKGAAEKIKIGNFPTLKDIMDQAIKAGVKIYACAQSCELLNMPKGDLIEGIIIAGAASVNDLVLEADGVLYF
jgi:predicted peroxiredoxin